MSFYQFFFFRHAFLIQYTIIAPYTNIAINNKETLLAFASEETLRFLLNKGVSKKAF